MPKPSKSAVSKAARAMSLARKHHRGGRPRNPDRCPCGKMTKERATKRNHQCG